MQSSLASYRKKCYYFYFNLSFIYNKDVQSLLIGVHSVSG
jgi:hypothetical protein